MRVKAIKDLSQLPDDRLFETIAEGLANILDNARRLYEDSEQLVSSNRGQGARILRSVAEEEAAKFLILVDAVRCPRDQADRFVRQLDRFNGHLAKGLYSRSCNWSPATLGQLQEYLDNHREEFYLDGPNGVDWIFRNDILQGREELLYVDYIANEDEHIWLHPSRFVTDLVLSLKGLRPGTLRICEALSSCGVATPQGLDVVALVWRGASDSIERKMKWPELRELNRRTLEELERKGLFQERALEVCAEAIDRWQFPLYDLDLAQIRTDKTVLRERQRSWAPY